MKTILRIGLGLVVFAVGTVAVVWFMTGDATKVAKQQIEAIRDNELQKAYDLGSTEFKDATSFEEFTTFVKQYEVLTEYEKSNFNSRSIDNNITTLAGTLTAKSGAEAEIEYRLLKEDGEWKVLGFEITGAGVATDEEETAAEEEEITLSRTFDETGYGYTIKYPSDWVYEESGESTVVFSGKEGSAAFATTVNIQNVTGTLTQVYSDLKEQFSDPELDSTLSTEKTYKHTAADGTSLSGKEFTVEYTYNGTEFKQRQLVIPGGTGEYLHALAYTAPIDQYDSGLATAEAMIETWAISTEE